MIKQTVCPHSGKEYTDISYSDVHNEQYVCGDCGERILIPAGTKLRGDVKVVVPRHLVPQSVAEFRATLERAAKSETKRAK